jgi:hypothetical protein
MKEGARFAFCDFYGPLNDGGALLVKPLFAELGHWRSDRFGMFVRVYSKAGATTPPPFTDDLAQPANDSNEFGRHRALPKDSPGLRRAQRPDEPLWNIATANYVLSGILVAKLLRPDQKKLLLVIYCVRVACRP